MVDPSPEIEKERVSELEKLAKQYGGGSGVDMTAFPQFKFPGKSLKISVLSIIHRFWKICVKTEQYRIALCHFFWCKKKLL